MALLKRVGLFGGEMRGAEIARATKVEDLIAAYRLVHDVFVEQGYIHANEAGIRLRPFEALPDTATFIARAGREVVGVTTVVMDSPEFGLPTEKAFANEIHALRSIGRVACEGTNWLIAESHRGSGVMTELMRCSFAHALALGCTDYLGAVSPGHAKFYDLLGFERLGDVRSYSKDIDDPVVLVRLDIAGLHQRFAGVTAGDGSVEAFLKHYYIDVNPYHRIVASWQVIAGRLFSDPLMLWRLFVGESGFLLHCGQEDQRRLSQRWGAEVFAQVLAEASAREPAVAAAGAGT
jgi:predicted N-acetyltransferase YhbS